jgi:hypothetical protein
MFGDRLFCGESTDEQYDVQALNASAIAGLTEKQLITSPGLFDLRAPVCCEQRLVRS